MAENVVAQIVERRKKDIEEKGYTFGYEIPKKRTRKIVPFMARKGVILEVKRASPSKGDIAPELDAVETALNYKLNGASAISCLTEENYFKGCLKDLIDICNAVDDVAVLRKDFLIDEEEIDIAYRCGADAVLLIAGILTLEKLTSMTERCKNLGIKALVEVRSNEDVQKVLRIKEKYEETIVCGVNSRNLRDFTIDLLVPAMLKKQLGGKVIFESGITTPQAAEKIASMGFSGILLGEFAARNPEKAGQFVKSFIQKNEDDCGKKLIELAQKVYNHKEKSDYPMVKICGIREKEDLLLADELGADFVGFIFATEYQRNVYGSKFEQLKSVLNKIKALKVAVVTRPESEEAKAAATLVKEGVLDFIQLHGIKYSEVPSYLQEVPHYFVLTDKNLIEESRSDELNSYGEPRFLQDCRTNRYGGTQHLWIAGGITAENVSTLIKKINPELIDVSSGIEDEKVIGKKNHKKLKKLFEEIKNV